MDRYKSNVAESLELLLERLIKMTGRTNETVCTLNNRIQLLEKRLAEHERTIGCTRSDPHNQSHHDSGFLMHL
ncbi:hypothetical protein A8F94_21290 [Bacillus sp. FJAT-27225]|uniref:hypothetical protein n=1 Tax=Bacillus sp. FJAT-27225 TaxID=1743144 RepID=UPI00080C3510|nr:hypothetical protein [Bacillus sp. FJAT-27225]OCA82439.1 hypothetical protein A8F94_21290 [Bacillus sp. FJAT-27225]